MAHGTQSVSVPVDKGAKTQVVAARGYAASSATTPLAPFAFKRRAVGPEDVQIEILYCGVCHSDLHQVRDEWKRAMPTVYPCVPGHEIIGRATKVGRAVKKFKEGDWVAVGCMVDACGECSSCKAGNEQFCRKSLTLTYNSPDKILGGVTYGGYSDSIVVREDFVLRVPKGLETASAAPLLCAGITTYLPLRHWDVTKGKKVAVVALGGLGHMALKFAHAFGAHTLLLTTSPNKATDAERLGADEVVVSTDPSQLQKHAGTLDFILDTASAPHDLNQYLALLKVDGTMTLVGAPEAPTPISAFSLITGRRSLAGSMIGGILETQEMLEFCGEHGIVSDVEVISIQRINEAYERMLKGDVRYRFVIDLAALQAAEKARPRSSASDLRSPA